ncbi:unnamed protein product [Nippostrongylus brasiliensis]|uniref:Uncharacterized protein n=1 Tax=Nippostrongylus brasiliensis TaxID=27835 RepID=A0A0N4XTD9_NIPBR|nr:unnamed protein product [Nippostrongylus brasiliensis]
MSLTSKTRAAMSHEELEAKEKEKNVIGLLSLLTNAVMHNSYILVRNRVVDLADLTSLIKVLIIGYVTCYSIIGICSRMSFVAPQMSPRSAEERVRVLEEALANALCQNARRMQRSSHGRTPTMSPKKNTSGGTPQGVDRSPLLEKNATGGTANVTSPLKISTSSCDQEVLYKRTEACIKCSNEAIDKRTFVIVDKQPTEANNDCTNHTSEDCIHQENMLHQSQEAGDQDTSFKCQFPDLPVIRKSIGESSVMEKFGELLRVPTFKMCVAL